MQIENPCDVFFVCKSLFCVFRGGGVGGRARLSVFNILFFIFEINLGSLDATVPAVAVGVGVGDSRAPRPPGCSTLTSLTSVCVFGTTPLCAHACTPCTCASAWPRTYAALHIHARTPAAVCIHARAAMRTCPQPCGGARACAQPCTRARIRVCTHLALQEGGKPKSAAER